MIAPRLGGVRESMSLGSRASALALNVSDHLCPVEELIVPRLPDRRESNRISQQPTPGHASGH